MNNLKEMVLGLWRTDSLAKFRRGYEEVVVKYDDDKNPKKGLHYRWGVEEGGYDRYLADFVNKMVVLATELAVGATALWTVLK